ncbi:hypothetical protein QO010_004088 [Caulobacter ginsengisoli]|uniref:DUF4350 domain-containing protein n=1 Tax=Caulobacter ginsengisoli TaxID=400775 RepID=A0ABU0IWB5_9CAUL|nr:hypothetical protein [Caulobacter ginsengisoli]MDQ0466295.1 hypothetical protein [Caulobacter ginsengisoli]
MRRFLYLLAALAVFATPLAQAQQRANPKADVSVARPTWPTGTGPRVVIDAGHANFHQVDGRYAPFAALLRNDGFRVEGQDKPFTTESLAGIDVLVVVNAINPLTKKEGRPLSAFTDDEIAAAKTWVEGGGRLLLVADHMPFAYASAKLGAAFGVTEWDDGFAMQNNKALDLFDRSSGLADQPITRGAGGDSPVTKIRTFTGSAFVAPGATPLIVLDKRFEVLTPDKPWDFQPSTPHIPADGLLQGASLTLGKGRVVLLGEAAFMTSQLKADTGEVAGFGAEGAEQNPQFVLNMMHWLAGAPGY